MPSGVKCARLFQRHSEALKEAKEAFDYVRRGKYMLESEKLENTELYRYFYYMYPESEKLVRELR